MDSIGETWLWWIGLTAFLIGPPLIGYGIGRCIRAPARGRLRTTVLVSSWLVAIATFAWGARPPALPFGAWDVLVALLLALAGIHAGAHAPVQRPRWRVAVAAAAIALVVIEAGMRLFTTPPPGMWDFGFTPPPAPFDRSTMDWERTSHQYVEPRIARIAERPARDLVVLHVGDSLVVDEGVESGKPFTEALNRIDPTAWHANGGVGGAGPDLYLSVLRNLRLEGRIDRVVVHINPTNDVLESAVPCPRCPGMLDGFDVLAGPIPAGHPLPLGSWLALSPAPMVLSELALVSHAARHAAWLISSWQAMRRPGFQDERSWTRLERVLHAIRSLTESQGVGLSISILPPPVVFRQPPTSPVDYTAVIARIVSIARGLGIPAMDASAIVRDTCEREGLDACSSHVGDRIDEHHLSRSGHEAYARWLLSQGTWKTGAIGTRR